MMAQSIPQKCIRSLRIARELMRRGFLPMDAEPDHGYLRYYLYK